MSGVANLDTTIERVIRNRQQHHSPTSQRQHNSNYSTQAGRGAFKGTYGEEISKSDWLNNNTPSNLLLTRLPDPDSVKG